MTTERRNKPLPTVAISISESPDMGSLGLSEGHLRDAMAKVALHAARMKTNHLIGNDAGTVVFVVPVREICSQIQIASLS